MARVTQPLASSVIPAPPEAHLALWQGVRQGIPRGAVSPTEECPSYVFFSPWAEGVVPKCMDLSRHQCDVRGSSGEANKPGCLTGGCSQHWGCTRPVPACASTAAFPNRCPQRDSRSRWAVVWGVHPSPCAHREGVS